MMIMSREPSDLEKIQAPSIEEIKLELQLLAKRLGNKLTFRGRKMGYGPLLNAVVINYLSLPPEQQLQIAKVGVARYEALLASDDPVADPRLVDAVPGAGGRNESVLISRVVTQRPDAKSKGKSTKANG